MALQVKCLPQKHEDLSSGPQNSEKLDETVHVCNPSTATMRQEMVRQNL